eukprot:CAMPEP_0175418490 /NCGR_PEP_ID=MMETSP0095-20121207/45742_1 /TAXON_ID=311494 /ORGANISM="Alexandrium monilatum, Strain CCMP3105" /LENGTH=94 /DNA_ID=CAMNT_0016717655 /DNA_START=31 /DNA_END=312 /DNA_ORIENTATION=-
MNALAEASGIHSARARGSTKARPAEHGRWVAACLPCERLGAAPRSSTANEGRGLPPTARPRPAAAPCRDRQLDSAKASAAAASVRRWQGRAWAA